MNIDEVQESPAITMANEKKEGISTDTTKSLPQFAAGCDSGHPGRVDPGRVSIVDAAGGSSLGCPQGRVPWQGGFLPPCQGSHLATGVAVSYTHLTLPTIRLV